MRSPFRETRIVSTRILYLPVFPFEPFLKSANPAFIPVLQRNDCLRTLGELGFPPCERRFTRCFGFEKFADLTILVFQKLVGTIRQDTAGRGCGKRAIRGDRNEVKRYALVIRCP